MTEQLYWTRLVEQLEAELAEIDAILDTVTKCRANTRVERILHSFEHTQLVSDACIFEAQKKPDAGANDVAWIKKIAVKALGAK